MAPTYPGVYVKEEALLPPSVAEVATAIPAFIGYTAIFKGSVPIVAEIGSLLDFEKLFGKAPAIAYKVKPDANKLPQLFLPSSATAPPAGGGGAVGGGTPAAAPDMLAPLSIRPVWQLWYSIDFYFRNGGGRCYVVAVGKATIDGTIDMKDLKDGLTALEKQDEPTLVVIPEATRLENDEFDDVAKEALNHCAKLMDRFAILDVKELANAAPLVSKDDQNAARKRYGDENLKYGAAYYPFLNTSIPQLIDQSLVTVEKALLVGVGAGTDDVKLDSLKNDANQTGLYNQIIRLLNAQRVTLPPSPAIAGSYVSVDRTRGVWKAPANIGLQAVISPVDLMTDERQGMFNIDATTGKSINAIRSFTGRGTVAWGARTLAGNDNEWRYIPVRRLFITIEESVKKATNFAVFEPNDASTWLKVKGMIESYLYSLWEQGALQGSKSENAYFVNVGLGKTMTAQDILNGLMNVEIGIAAVRPAEFIILKFSHRLAQA
jgi:phage tail sheath protein FI